MQVEWKWCNGLIGTTLSISFTQPTTYERRHHSPPYNILCDLSTGTISKCHFSSGLPSGSPKIGTLVVPKLWRFVSFSNQVCYENAGAIFYIPQKDLSNDVRNAPIGPHLTPTFKGFMVRSQILNLIRTLFFNHNSCTLGLNELCESTLSIYVLGPF